MQNPYPLPSDGRDDELITERKAWQDGHDAGYQARIQWEQEPCTEHTFTRAYFPDWVSDDAIHFRAKYRWQCLECMKVEATRGEL